MKIEQIHEDFEIESGAPLPTILSNEHVLYLIFYIQDYPDNWNARSIRERTNKDEKIVSVKFNSFRQYKFGSPNDEAMSGHPLYKHGLRPYAIQKVNDSEWIKTLIKMNSVHPYHRDAYFSDLSHFIFFFHDSCFEIIANEYTVEQNSELTMYDEIQRIAQKL